MTAEPKFTLISDLGLTLSNARGPARVPEGKGGHVFVDGQLHRILDLTTMLKGKAAFAYSVNEKELIHMCAHLDVKALGFKGLRTTTIAPLLQLARLDMLSLWWVQKLADLTPLSGMKLQSLVLDDIRYANDIRPVAAIQDLRALTIAGGMNSTQLVNSLQPLSDLPKLTELWTVAIKLGDDSLRPLVKCAALRDLNLPNTFPTEEYAYLRAKRSDIRCTALAAYQKSGFVSDGKDVMVTGRRKPFLSTKRDAERLAKYQTAFDGMVAAYQAQ